MQSLLVLKKYQSGLEQNNLLLLAGSVCQWPQWLNAKLMTRQKATQSGCSEEKCPRSASAPHDLARWELSSETVSNPLKFSEKKLVWGVKHLKMSISCQVLKTADVSRRQSGSLFFLYISSLSAVKIFLLYLLVVCVKHLYVAGRFQKCFLGLEVKSVGLGWKRGLNLFYF